MERGPDDAWLRFYLDPRATFADGKPITAEDVRYTFDLLMSKGSLRYRTQFADVSGVTVEGPRSVRFDFKPSTAAPWRWTWPACRCCPNTTGSSATSPTVPASTNRWAAGRTASGSTTAAASPSSATRLVGQDLPVSRGLYNFDHLRIEYFGDTEVARQVLKGGGYDYNREFSATAYTIGYNGGTGRRPPATRPPGPGQAAGGPGLRVQPDQPQFRTAACVRHWACSGTSSGATGR
jgi:microcin C transport system substrate-binding protein